MKKRIAVGIIGAGLVMANRPYGIEEAGVGVIFEPLDNEHIVVTCTENNWKTIESVTTVTLRKGHDAFGSCPTLWHWALTDKGKVFIYGPNGVDDQIQLVY